MRQFGFAPHIDLRLQAPAMLCGATKVAAIRCEMVFRDLYPRKIIRLRSARSGKNIGSPNSILTLAFLFPETD